MDSLRRAASWTCRSRRGSQKGNKGVRRRARSSGQDHVTRNFLDKPSECYVTEMVVFAFDI